VILTCIAELAAIAALAFVIWQVFTAILLVKQELRDIRNAIMEKDLKVQVMAASQSTVNVTQQTGTDADSIPHQFTGMPSDDETRYLQECAESGRDPDRFPGTTTGNVCGAWDAQDHLLYEQELVERRQAVAALKVRMPH
jgi:hypothetical protein